MVGKGQDGDDAGSPLFTSGPAVVVAGYYSSIYPSIGAINGQKHSGPTFYGYKNSFQLISPVRVTITLHCSVLSVLPGEYLS